MADMKLEVLVIPASFSDPAAHGEHEQRVGAADVNWPDWYADSIVREQAGAGLPT